MESNIKKFLAELFENFRSCDETPEQRKYRKDMEMIREVERKVNERYRKIYD